jgi:hypothetical protein
MIMNRIFKMIKEIADAKFYGEVVIRFRDGVPTFISKKETCDLTKK